MRDRLTRRTVLRLSGVAAAASVAGCVGAQRGTNAPAGGGGSTTDGQVDDHGDDAHDDGHAHDGSIPEEPVANAEVRMLTNDQGHHFDPHVVWVEEGGTITFHNESGAHTATAYAPAYDRPRRIPEGATPFDTGMVSEAGAKTAFTLDAPGVYDYYCVPHEGMGMVGSVVVGRPDPHDQPGMTDPQASIPRGARERIHELNEMCNEVLGHAHEGSGPETDGHREGTATGHYEGDGHHGTETGHYEEDGHHGTETGHYEGDGHHHGTTTGGHHGGDGHHH